MKPILSEPDAEVISELASRIAGMLRGEEGHQWKWADVAAAAPNEDVLRMAADRAGFFETHTWGTMQHWRVVGLAWPEDKREPATSFTSHAELASVQPPERRWALMRPNLSKREARRQSGRKAMKDDMDAGFQRMLDDEAHEDLILDKALEIEAQRNRLIVARLEGEAEPLYLTASRYSSTSLSALNKALEIAKQLDADERQLVLEQVQEIAARAAHAPAVVSSVPDELPANLGSASTNRRAS
jgi:hypothetical protein